MREQLFQALATLIERRRSPVLILSALLFGVSIWCVVNYLEIDSSRHAIVNEDDREQQLLIAFNQRFGTNDILLLVEGGPVTERRTAMDRIAQELLNKEVAENVSYRLNIAEMSHIAAWYLQADSLKRLTSGLQALPKARGAKETPLRLSGVHGVVQQLNEALEAFADGDTGGGAPPNIKDHELSDATQAVEKVFDELIGWLNDATRTGFDLSELRSRTTGPIKLDPAGYMTVGPENALVMRIRGKGDVINPDVAVPLLDQTTQIIQSHLPDGATFGFAGIPAIVSDENKAIGNDMSLTGTVSAVGCLLLFLLAYRTLGGMLAIMAALFTGIAWGLGYAVFAIDKMTMFTSSFLVIIIGMGIDFGVHLFTRIRIERLGGASPTEAARTALVGTGPPILIGAMTSAAAFGVMAFTEFKGTYELGIMASGALLCVLLASFIVLPAILGHPKSRLFEAKDGPRQAGLRLCLPYSMRYIAIGAGVAFTLWTATAIRPIEWDLNSNNLLPQDTPALKTMARLEQLGLGQLEFAGLEGETLDEVRRHTNEAAALVESGVASRVESILDALPSDVEEKAPVIAALRAAANAQRAVDFESDTNFQAQAFINDLKTLRGLLEDDIPFTLGELGQQRLQPFVARLARKVADLERSAVALPATALPGRILAFEEAVQALIPGIKRFMDTEAVFAVTDLPESTLAAFQSTADGRVSYATRVYPNGDVADAGFVTKFRQHLRAIDNEATGYAVNYAYFGEIFARSFRDSLLYASSLVILLVWLDVRSLRDTFLSLLPLVLGAIWMVGLMYIFEIQFTFGNGISLPLIIGIGVDSGVHLVHAWREHGQNVREAVRTSGKAITISSFTTIIAFGSMYLARYDGLRSLGIVLVIGVLSCLIATLFVLPAVMYLFGESQTPASPHTK